MRCCDSAAAGQQLTLNECRRLAYNSWDLDTLAASSYAQQAAALQSAAEHCPADCAARARRPRYLRGLLPGQRRERRLADGAAAPSAPALRTDRSGHAMLAQRDTAVAAAGALGALDDSFFRAVRARGTAVAAPIRGQLCRDHGRRSQRSALRAGRPARIRRRQAACAGRAARSRIRNSPARHCRRQRWPRRVRASTPRSRANRISTCAPAS